MKMIDADIVWTPDQQYNDDVPNRGSVRVERHGNDWKRTTGDRWMPATSLGYYGHLKTKGDHTKQLLGMFLLFNTIVVRDGIAAADAHNAFLRIEEYRQTISPDAPGAET